MGHERRVYDLTHDMFDELERRDVEVTPGFLPAVVRSVAEQLAEFESMFTEGEGDGPA